MFRTVALDGRKVIRFNRERLKARANARGTVWTDFFSPTDDEQKLISQEVGITIEDLNKHYYTQEKRAGIEDVGKYSIFTFYSPVFMLDRVHTALLTIFISKDRIITLHTHELTPLDRIMSMSDDDIEHSLSKGTGFLLFTLLQSIIREYFHIQNHLEDKINMLEDRVFKEQNDAVVKEIFVVKKTMLFLRKSLNSNRDIVNYLQNGFAGQMQGKDLTYVRFIYNDLMELVDFVAIYNDILTSIMDTYTSSVSNRLNIMIKKMTAVGTLFLIPSIFASIYGMNFINFPEIHWRYGYAFFWFMTLACMGFAYYIFKRYDWV